MLCADGSDKASMVFNSLTFLALFAVVLGIHHLKIPWSLRKTSLLLASFVFYAAWNPPFIVLLWLSTAIDWIAARRIHASKRPAARRAWFLVSLCSNLGLLGVFKYGDFVLENIGSLLGALGFDHRPEPMGLILPMGISFYTFQTMSYTIDVYRRQTKPWTSCLDFALYVSFFPQLVAGPILRGNEFLPQCTTERRASGGQLSYGLSLMIVGLAAKCVLADAVFAPVADAVFGAKQSPLAFEAWAGTLAFSGQIYFDFCGYSLIATGAALALGFHFPDNFRVPYAAIGFSDFWRRWHISLSTWLRDYLYIPLGGNRNGRARTNINLMLTMLLGGLWHGAAWNFVIWGGLHGLYLLMERLVREPLGRTRFKDTRLASALGVILTFALVCFAWVFFRARGVDSALGILAGMFGMGTTALPGFDRTEGLTALAAMAFVLAGHWILRERTLESAADRMPWCLRGLILGIALVLIVTMGGADRAFIYFQF